MNKKFNSMRKKIFVKTKENNFAFIDSQNLNLGVQSLGWKLDYKRFRIYLKEKYKNNYSSLLRKFVPNIAFMNTLKEKLKYKKSP